MDDNGNAILDVLVCPKTRAGLVLDGDRLVSRDEQTRLAYPVREGIPIMLADEASELTAEEWSSVMATHEESNDEAN